MKEYGAVMNAVLNPVNCVFTQDNESLGQELLKDDIKFQMIYLDPPYATGREWELSGGSFFDKFEPELLATNLRCRFLLAKDLLEDTGVIVVQCDYHLSHLVRLHLDEVFGREKFVNEIIWQRCNPKRTTRKLSCDHDTIFIYAKDKNKFFQQYIELNEKTIKRYDKVDKNGRKYMLRGITAPGSRNLWDFGIDETKPKDFRGYGWSKERIEQGIVSGDVIKTSTGLLAQVSYLDESRGRAVDDIWTDIGHVQGNEKHDYPTQKPEALMNRLLDLFTESGDLIFDMYCGSGTLCFCAYHKHRKFIGCDINQEAIDIVEKRLGDLSDVCET